MPGDVDDPQPQVRIAHPLEQPPHPAQPELARRPRHPQPLIIEPAVKIAEPVLIIVLHGAYVELGFFSEWKTLQARTA